MNTPVVIAILILIVILIILSAFFLPVKLLIQV